MSDRVALERLDQRLLEAIQKKLPTLHRLLLTVHSSLFSHSLAGKRRRDPILNTASQATKIMIIACNITTQSLETFLVNMSMNKPDLFSAPKRIAASKTPRGWFLPSSATAIPVK